MRVHIFLGPTLSREGARRELEAEYLPPVSQGDVLRSMLRRPAVIGIVDGYFRNVPAVWHKEILWAMAQGVHVYGSASMGALRAAELHTFGMIGIGSIFGAFRDGTYEDDDEVALAHGDADSGYIALSVPMVDIRATIARSRAVGIVSSATETALLGIAKAMHYPQRTYNSVMHAARHVGLPGGELEALRKWLPAHRVALKREDAIAMLREIRSHVERGIEPKRVDYYFAHTDAWEHVLRTAVSLDSPPELGSS
jgi:hypothetical protein